MNQIRAFIQLFVLAIALSLLGAASEDWESAVRRADTLMGHQEFSEAKESALSGESLASSFDLSDVRRRRSWNQLATIFDWLGEVGAAEPYFQRVYEFDREYGEESTSSLLDLATFYSRHSQFSKAEKVLLSRLKGTDDLDDGWESRGRIRRSLAEVYERSGRLEEARLLLVQLVEAKGYSVDDLDRAELLLRLAAINVAVAAKSPDEASRKSLLHKAMKQIDRSDKHFDKARSRLPLDEAESMRLRARIARDLGNQQAALDWDRKADEITSRWMQSQRDHSVTERRWDN